MKMCQSDLSKLRRGETLDTIFQGRLKIIQPQQGYRFSIDAVLLAGLTLVRPQDRIVDLGTGCGIVPLLLASQQSVKHITGIEIQESLVSMAKRNVLINGFEQFISIVQADLRGLEVTQAGGLRWRCLVQGQENLPPLRGPVTSLLRNPAGVYSPQG